MHCVPLHSGKLNKDLHKTVNFRAHVVNMLALRRSLRLIKTKKLTFQEVYDAKVAFDLYDHEADHEGIFLKDLTAVSRALKLSGRIIAPAHLPFEIKRITRSVEMPSRLQLHEFLELVASCPRTKDMRVSYAATHARPGASGSSTRQNIYDVQDFKSMLIPEERRLENKLNAQQHWKTFKMKYTTARIIKRDVQEKRARMKAMKFQSEVDHVDEVGEPKKSTNAKWW